MNVKRFTARTSRDALGLVKQAFGQDAVVLSTRPCAEGVEVLAMPPDAMPSHEHAAAPRAAPAPARRALPSPAALAESSPAKDAEQLSMSTLSFQDYVRERMLRRRKAELQAQNEAASPPTMSAQTQGPAAFTPPVSAAAASQRLSAAVQSLAAMDIPVAAPPSAATSNPLTARAMAQSRRHVHASNQTTIDLEQDDAFRNITPPQPPVLDALVDDRASPGGPRASAGASAAVGVAVNTEQLLQEMRETRRLIEQRFGSLAYLDKIKREPRQAQLLMSLLQAGFSPSLTRRLADKVPPDGSPTEWVASMLERNLHTAEREPALEDAGGTFALIGPTGAGKTTCTAKLAAAFAGRHGASQLGLITLDAYRSAAHDQLRGYGRVLGVSVHTAHDRASLDDLLDLLSGKKLVLIDTAGLSHRDERTAELLDMLGHPAVQRLLVLNATAHGETLDDVINSYRGEQCHGIVLSKLDEVVKLGPALDAAIRHKLKVTAVANGQRVPEDWHRVSAAALVQRALHTPEAASWKLEADDIRLVFMHTPHGEEQAT